MDALRNSLVVLSAARRDSAALVDPIRLATDLVGEQVDAVAGALLDPWLEDGGTVLWPIDPQWPSGLTALGPAAPLMLWVRGQLPPEPADCLAVVGSRACTEYGRRTARDLAATGASMQRWIVSGGATGIDASAHWGALQSGGDTVLVAAGGAGRVYPAEHRELFARCGRRGAVVWEYPRTVGLHRQGFLTRNRLIAAMAGTTVVVEAAERSGALNTGRTAADLGRLVLAVPGPIDSRSSAGCHRAIADGWAAILLGPADLRQLVDASV